MTKQTTDPVLAKMQEIMVREGFHATLGDIQLFSTGIRKDEAKTDKFFSDRKIEKPKV